MPRGRTNSNLGLAARRERAKELFIRGWTNVEVAREIQISPGTAARYRELYEADIKQQAHDNPTLLQDVLGNTFKALGELDQIRQEAWKQYEATGQPSQKATFLNTALKASDARHKVLQLFGVKAEYMDYVARISKQQEMLIEFLGEVELCAHDRELIANFVETMMTFNAITSLPEASEITT